MGSEAAGLALGLGVVMVCLGSGSKSLDEGRGTEVSQAGAVESAAGMGWAGQVPWRASPIPAGQGSEVGGCKFLCLGHQEGYRRNSAPKELSELGVPQPSRHSALLSWSLAPHVGGYQG